MLVCFRFCEHFDQIKYSLLELIRTINVNKDLNINHNEKKYIQGSGEIHKLS